MFSDIASDIPKQILALLQSEIIILLNVAITRLFGKLQYIE